MKIDELFTRAVALLPGEVRERLDGDFPVDWTELEDAATGTKLGEAVRARRRLPKAVEVLVSRLIMDVGIVPADLAAGAERQGAATAWIHWVTIEADGESYHLRNDRSGDVRTDIRPEAVAGYATLGMDLATVMHDTVERWIEAGGQHRATAEDERGVIARCAVRMHAHLQAQPDTISGERTAASLARALELAWNTQGIDDRAALAAVRLSTARGARAPRRSYYVPDIGYRLHACDIGEIRWLRALADRAAVGAGIGEPGPAARENPAAASGQAATPAGAPAEAAPARPRRARPEPSPPSRPPPPPAAPQEGTLKLGSDPDDLSPETEVVELERAATSLPGAIRRRMGEAYGARVAEALARFQTAREVDAIREQMGSAGPGRAAPAPRWLEELAATLMVDTGAQRRDGRRIAGMRLDSRRQSDGGRRASEVETGAFGHLTPAGLVEQVRLSLVFAHDAWTGLAALRNAGKEGEWALNEAQAGNNRLSTTDRETLEAARDIGQALGRVQRSFARSRGDGKLSAMQQAEMAAETLRAVGPTVRTAVGWPGAAPAPDAGNPEDVARIASVGEALHGEIRTVANRLIAGWVAEVQAYGENRNG